MKKHSSIGGVMLMVLLAVSSVAQDFRTTQYMAAPMLLNPALTGDYAGSSFRMLLLYSHLSNDSGRNTIQNFSIDQSFGRKGLWAIGINYMRSGAPSFPMYGDYWGFSIAKGINLDQSGRHQLRGGVQLSYFNAGYDASKGNYQRVMDVSVLKFYPNFLSPRFTGKATYWNLALGVAYKLVINQLIFETGISAYNVTNPSGWNIMPQSYFRKRYRMSTHSFLSYAVNASNTYRMEYYSWKEGLYLRNYEPALEGNTEIQESTVGLSWLRTTKNPWSFGLFTRGWKSAYGILKIAVKPTLSFAVSYELPMHKAYYNVTHLEFSAAVIPFNKKIHKKINPPEDRSDKAFYPASFPVLRQYKPDSIHFYTRRRMLLINDKDGDGILNELDKCPSVFGSLYNAGCPLQEEISPINKVAENKLVIPDLQVKNIYFEYNASALTQTGLVLANKVVDFLKINKEYNIYLLGLASKEGGFDYNMKLSRKRAITVASYLMSFGIERNRIFTYYAGNRLALIKTGDRESRWPDRKVAIRIKSQFEY